MRREFVIVGIIAFVATVGFGVGLATTQRPPSPGTPTETATFAGGCFWGLEAAFRQLNGVTDTVVGYTGGTSRDPTYQDVASRRVDHLEACRVTYDPALISYQRLVEYFLEIHDGTIVHRQSPYLGSPARLVIFFQNPEQQRVAMAAKARLPQLETNPRSPLIQILSESQFYRAEEYHQRYLEKHGLASCRVGS